MAAHHRAVDRRYLQAGTKTRTARHLLPGFHPVASKIEPGHSYLIKPTVGVDVGVVSSSIQDNYHILQQDPVCIPAFRIKHHPVLALSTMAGANDANPIDARV